jgi:hypothetical protein
VLNFMMINSPGGPRKADDCDHPLIEVRAVGAWCVLRACVASLL